MVMKKKAAAPVKKAAAKRGPAPKAAATKRRPVEDDDDEELEEDEDADEDVAEDDDDEDVNVEATGDFTVTVHRSVTHRYEDGTLDNWTSTATGTITPKMDAPQAQAQINAMRVATGMAIGADYASGKGGIVVIGEPAPLRKTAASTPKSSGGAAKGGAKSGGSSGGGGDGNGYTPKEKKALWNKLIEDITEEEEVPPSNWWDNRTDRNGKRSKWPNFKPKKEVMEELGFDRDGDDIKPLYMKEAPEALNELLEEYGDPF